MRNSEENTRLQDFNDSDKTLAVPGLLDAKEIQAAEAEVAIEWDVGDVILDLYEVIEVHSGGGMGLVYRVLHKGWNTQLAVKSPRENYFKTEEQKKNFIKECETWIDLGLHPHVVSCYYVRNLGNIPRVFAEYVEGGNLKEWISSKKLYEGGPDKAPERILDIAIQTAWGIQYAHEKSVIHQDIKPANIMLTEDGTVKITDFGLARARAIVEESSETDSEKNILMTSYGMTPAYCSPEQANKEKLTTKTDIWSWAITVMEMFTGEVIWAAGQIADKALEEYIKTIPVNESLPRMPRDLADVLKKSLQRDPKNRPKDILEIASRLEDVYKHVTNDKYPRGYPKPTELTADSLNNKAVSLIDLGNLDEAENIYNQLLEEFPGHYRAEYNRGLLKWLNREITDREFLNTIEKYAEASPVNWEIKYLLGLVHLGRGDMVNAMEILKNADKLSGGNFETETALHTIDKNKTNGIRCIKSFGPSKFVIKSMEVDPAEKYLMYTGGEFEGVDGHLLTFTHPSVAIWRLDISTGNNFGFKLENGDTSIEALSFNNDMSLALTGYNNGIIKLWDMKSPIQCISTFIGHSGAVHCIDIGNDNSLIVSGSSDSTIRVWDTKSKRCIHVLKDHDGDILSLAFGQNLKWIMSAGCDKVIRLWDPIQGKLIRRFEGHTDQINCIHIDGTNKLAVSGSNDKTIRLWNISSSKCVGILKGHTEAVNTIDLSPDSTYLVSGSDDRTVRLWDLSTGRCIRTLEGHKSSIQVVRFCDKGNRILSAGGE